MNKNIKEILSCLRSKRLNKKKCFFSRIKFVFFIVSALALYSLSLSVIYAAPNANNVNENELPIRVTSDDMLYDMDKNTVDFKGNVVAVRGEFILRAPLMTIYMLKDNQKNEEPSSVPQSTPLTGKKEDTPSSVQNDSNIEKITASHGVNFTYGTQSGSSDSAVYIAKTGVLTMYGDPIVRDGENQIQGETIRYYMNENRSEVVGTDKKRVEAIFKK